MIRLALVGLGKMGLSHLAIVRAHPDVELVAVCDSTRYVLDTLAKCTGLTVHSDYDRMLETEALDAVLVATPSRFHAEMVGKALARGLHVFCEKPFCLDPADGKRLAALAREKGVVNQVGYHYRFVGAFQEAKRMISAGALGQLHNLRAEAYGPVVLRPKNATWRANRSEGGGCLYDYASHAIDLVHYLVGPPDRVGGTVLGRVFSRDVEDEVYATLFFPGGLSGQLSVNWSDDSLRKMSTKLSIWGTNGRLTVDRQEMQLFVRDPALSSVPVKEGWTIAYTTALSTNQYYYLRGEEYSAQIDFFIQAIKAGERPTFSDFTSAAQTDAVAAMLVDDAAGVPAAMPAARPAAVRPAGLLGRAKALLPALLPART